MSKFCIMIQATDLFSRKPGKLVIRKLKRWGAAFSAIINKSELNLILVVWTQNRYIMYLRTDMKWLFKNVSAGKVTRHTETIERCCDYIMRIGLRQRNRQP